MLRPRTVAAATVANSKIFVPGGRGGGSLASVEVFNPSEGIWMRSVSLGAP